MKLRQHLLSIIIMMSLTVGSSLLAQPRKPVFSACDGLMDMQKMEDCEKGKLLNFIYKDLWSYTGELKKKFAHSKYFLSFAIDTTGNVSKFKIFEQPDDPMEAILAKIESFDNFKPIRIPDFRSQEMYQVSYLLPENRIMDFDITQLTYYKFGDDIFKVVELMPIFPGCYDEETDTEMEACARVKLTEYIYSNLKYPKEAIKNKVDGQVVVQFVVETDGSLSTIRIARDIGYGCGQAAVDVVESMNHMPERWMPGEHKGKFVRVVYTLPVKFSADKMR